MSTPLIRMHPEACPGQPRTVRWIVPGGGLPAPGPVREAPGPLGGLLRDGVLEQVVVEDGAVRITCAAGQEWPALGGQVRAALASSLPARKGWVRGERAAERGGPSAGPVRQAGLPRRDGVAGDVEPGDGSSPVDDAALRAAVEAALAGPAGDVVRAHFGRVDIVDVRDGRVEVRLLGACAGCAAAAGTLHGRLEREIRTREPGLVDLREASGRSALAARLRRGLTAFGGKTR